MVRSQPERTKIKTGTTGGGKLIVKRTIMKGEGGGGDTSAFVNFVGRSRKKKRTMKLRGDNDKRGKARVESESFRSAVLK